MDGSGPDRLSFLARRLPPAFEIRAVSVAPGRMRAYHEADWRDSLVVVEGGEIELDCLGGSRQRFRRGDVLWLVGLPLRALHNRGTETTLLVAVTRRRGPLATTKEEAGWRR
jgi:quercetin dioxygenase-like cupin family protein